MSYNFITQIIYNVITFFTRKKAIKKETLIDENNFIIRQPKAGLIVLIIITLSCFSLMVLGFVIDEWLISLFLLLGSLLFAFFIVLWFKSKIIVKGNQITSMSKFGRKKEYTFDYITEVKCGVVLTGYQEFEPYIEGYHEKERLFHVNVFFSGYYYFRSLLEKKGVPFVDAIYSSAEEKAVGIDENNFTIVLGLRREITVKGNQITSTSFFGRKKEYTFDYITEVKYGVVELEERDQKYMQGYHEKERLFVIDADNPGFYVLRSLLEKKGVPFVDKEN